MVVIHKWQTTQNKNRRDNRYPKRSWRNLSQTNSKRQENRRYQRWYILRINYPHLPPLHSTLIQSQKDVRTQPIGKGKRLQPIWDHFGVGESETILSRELLPRTTPLISGDLYKALSIKREGWRPSFPLLRG